jgi:hypothetical protein
VIVEDHVPSDVFIVERAVQGIFSGNDSCSTRKDVALVLEKQTLRAGDGHDVNIQTEAYTPGTMGEKTMFARAAHGDHVRFLIASQEMRHSLQEERALAFLAHHGIAVRVSRTAEKMAVVGHSARVGSANMTPGVRHQINWAIRLPVSLAPDVQARFTRNWNEAQPLNSNVL